MLAIRLPPEIEKRLTALAKRTGRTKTYYVREAVLEHLADLEDYYLAAKTLADIRSGKTKTKTLEEAGNTEWATSASSPPSKIAGW